MKLKVVNTKAADIRVPTSDTLLGQIHFIKNQIIHVYILLLNLSDGT